MRSRLRSLDSKISFFAFADIITAVSGMLIFITLLLATDLDRLADTRPVGADSESEQRLQAFLRQQAEAEAQNRRLQELLATAETAPAAEKLESDIARLRSQISEERQKQAALTAQITNSLAAMESRDKTLGLTNLKANIQRVAQEAEAIAVLEAKARGEMGTLEYQVARLESQLLKLRKREGQVWLIPDKSATSKEPILVTVSGAGATIERFDKPAQRRQLDKTSASSGFKLYLREVNSLNQYFVFQVRPSGIKLFDDLVKSARDMGYDVGYDALDDQAKLIHFETPPGPDEPATAPITPPATSAQTPVTSGNSFGPQTNTAPIVTPPLTKKPQPAAMPSAAPPPKTKSWWQRFLEWIGLA